MPIADFLGADPGYRLRTVRVVPFGGSALELRPISLGEFFVLWRELAPWLPRWEKMLNDGSAGVPFERLDRKWEGPCFRRAFEVLWPDHPVSEFDRADVDELQAVLDWFIAEHSWIRIFAGVFGGLGGELGKETVTGSRLSDDEALDRLLTVEVMGGRSLETILSMRCEAAISYLASFARVSKEVGSARQVAAPSAAGEQRDGRSYTIRGLSWDQLAAMGGGLPKEEEN
jgi:hypothetical protein